MNVFACARREPLDTAALAARLDTLHEERARVMQHLDLVERRIEAVARELRESLDE